MNSAHPNPESDSIAIDTGLTDGYDSEDEDYDHNKPPPTLIRTPLDYSNLWGMPLDDDIEVIQPPLLSPEFKWKESEYSNLGPPTEPSLLPAPSVAAENGFIHPEAKTYELMRDARYRRGWIFVAPFDAFSKSEHRDRLLRSVIHENIHAEWNMEEEKFKLREVPGMIRLLPGIPIVESPIHCPDHVITAVVLHTLDSVMQYEEGPRVRELAEDLRRYTFGCLEGPNQRPLRPVYEYLSVRNDRSVKAENLPNGSYDGSYNIAGTNQKGQGLGCFAPAVQTATPEAQNHFSHILQILNELRQILFEISLSKFEMESVEFLHEDNNIPSAGGLTSGGTGAQINIASVFRGAVHTGDLDLRCLDLVKSIGSHQGGTHGDISDDCTQNTLGTLMVQLPAGSHAGAFAFLRHACYASELDVWIMFLIFRGNDLHSGFAPSKAPLADSEIDEVHKVYNSSVNRVFYVLYPNDVGSSRISSMAMGPPSHFGNQGAYVRHKLKSLNFSQHGQHILGTTDDAKNRLGRDFARNFSNQLEVAGMRLKIPLNDLLALITYHSETDEEVSLKPQKYDIFMDKDHIHKWRCYYQFHRKQCFDYLIRITKREYRDMQNRLKMGSTERCNSTSHFRLPITIASARTVPTVQPELAIKEVKNRVTSGGTPAYTLLLEDGREEVVQLTDPRQADIKSIIFTPTYNTSRLQYPAWKQILYRFIVSDVGSDMPGAAFRGLKTSAMEFSQGSSAVEEQTTPTNGRTPQISNVNSTTQDIPADTDTLSGSAVQEAHAMVIDSVESVAATKPKRDLKRKRADTPDDQEQYSVEHILCCQEVHNAPNMYFVKWANYDEMSWIPRENFRGEDDLLSAFDRTPISLHEFLKCDLPDLPFKVDRHEILSGLHLSSTEQHSLFTQPNFILTHSSISSTPDPDISESEDQEDTTDRTDGDFIPGNRKKAKGGTVDQAVNGQGKKKKTRTLETDIAQQSDSNAAQCLTLDESFLQGIFDASRLNSEKKELEDSHVLLERGLRGRPQGMSEIVNRLRSMIDNNNVVAEMQLFMPADEFSHDLAYMVINQLVDAVEMAPDVATEMERQLVLARALQWQTSQSLLVVYRWHAFHGPRLADHLISIYRHRGAELLSQLYPTFGTLMCSIATYGKRVQSAKANQSKKGSKGRQHITSDHSDSDNKVPADLFGILPKCKAKRVTLPDLGQVFGPGEERLFDKVKGCFLDVIWNEVIAPKMNFLDSKVNGESKAKAPSASKKGLKSRLISRGAILNCIVEAWGGDDICTSSMLHHIIVSPMRIFSGPAANDFNKFSSCISNENGAALFLLSRWITNFISRSATVQETAAQIAQLVHRGLMEIKLGRRITLEEFLDPNKPIDKQGALSSPIKRSKHSPRPVNFGFSLSDILQDSNGPRFVILNIILREALNESRKQPAGHPQLRRVLEGLHFSTGHDKCDRDHFDPNRVRSQYSNNLRKRLPPSELTKRNGLSNLLTFMGTGQSMPTTLFQNLASMIFVSLDDAIQRFDSALMRSDQKHRRVKVSNSQVWGQSNCYLDLFPRKYYWNYTGLARTQAIREKLAPYWTDSILEAWTMFLVDMLDKDPAQYKGSHWRTWRETWQFIKDLGITPFRSGLTAFQLANNLAILGICQPPTPYEIAEWIDENRGFGAFRGLLKLGFNLSTPDTIYVAFMIVHDHLNNFLSTDDCDILEFSRFGAILVEHVLCKVGRWEDRVGKDVMLDICTEVEKNGEWVKGANAEDSQCCPFPHRAASDRLQTVLDEVREKMIGNIV